MPFTPPQETFMHSLLDMTQKHMAKSMDAWTAQLQQRMEQELQRKDWELQRKDRELQQKAEDVQRLEAQLRQREVHLQPMEQQAGAAAWAALHSAYAARAPVNMPHMVPAAEAASTAPAAGAHIGGH
jgi:hypothetical protein